MCGGSRDHDAMKIIAIQSQPRGLLVTWQDNTVSEFPWIWLRDNDVAELHPQTHERTFDLTSVPLNISPLACRQQGDGIRIDWPDRDTAAHYPEGWLYAYRPGAPRADPARIERHLWDGKALSAIPQFSAKRCQQSPGALREALRALKRTGLIRVDELADAPSAGADFGALVGFMRETNFGLTFDVELKRDPNNLAYTSVHLPLHSDLTNQELMPGYQFLHCYKNTVTGGASVFADGFRIAEDLRREHPGHFRLLSEVAVPCRFHDELCDIRSRRKVITLSEDGTAVEEFALNAHLADVPDMPPALLYDYYAAYQDAMVRCRAPNYAVHCQLQPGQMVIFDNRRVLHGRAAFDGAKGERHLRGYYIDRVEVDSCLRQLG